MNPILEENRALRERLRETEYKLAAALYGEAVAPPTPVLDEVEWWSRYGEVRVRVKHNLLSASYKMYWLRQAPAVLCACGRSHPAPEWVKLPFVGLGGDEVERFELRNCPCNSTIARRI